MSKSKSNHSQHAHHDHTNCAHDQEHTHAMATGKIGRNDPCHCGSGKKYKKCCIVHHQADHHHNHTDDDHVHSEHCNH